MLSENIKVLVYDEDIEKWTFGHLESKYDERWKIQTVEGNTLFKYVKEDYNNLEEDDCAYVVNENLNIQASTKDNKLNFYISINS